jgi:hypothetical protein
MRRFPLVFFLFAALVVPAAPAAAQSIGVGAGVVKLENDDESSLFLTGNLRLTLVGPLKLEPEVGYWKRTARLGPAEASFEDFSLGANGVVVIPAHPLELFGGLGVGAHFLNRSAGIAGLTRDSDATEVALHLLAGVDFRVSDTLNFFGAVRRDAFGDDSEARDQTKFYGGLRFKF